MVDTRSTTANPKKENQENKLREREQKQTTPKGSTQKLVRKAAEREGEKSYLRVEEMCPPSPGTSPLTKEKASYVLRSFRITRRIFFIACR